MRGLNNRHGPDTVKTDTVRTWPGECEDTVRTLSIVGSDRARIKSRHRPDTVQTQSCSGFNLFSFLKVYFCLWVSLIFFTKFFLIKIFFDQKFFNKKISTKAFFLPKIVLTQKIFYQKSVFLLTDYCLTEHCFYQIVFFNKTFFGPRFCFYQKRFKIKKRNLPKIMFWPKIYQADHFQPWSCCFAIICYYCINGFFNETRP